MELLLNDGSISDEGRAKLEELKTQQNNINISKNYNKHVKDGFVRNSSAELIEDKLLEKLDEEDTRYFTRSEQDKYIAKEAELRLKDLNKDVKKKIKHVEKVEEIGLMVKRKVNVNGL